MIFDTDVLAWALLGSPSAARALDSVTDRGLSFVTFMELMQGARSKSEERQIRQSIFNLQLTVVPLSESIGATAVALVEQHALAQASRSPMR